ncbi:MAG TPA: sugar kinase [Rectinema sp.]|nr:sugar kinase [Rectinema sp.]HNY98450.1 sugar kinase [Rectinema sp.]HOR48273.1 sugar kinase [Rectinema sp.]HPB06735.1 sugar kinase [Rectinema sp.]HPL71497.1 sugar kinase [Rectinema sp.]
MNPIRLLPEEKAKLDLLSLGGLVMRMDPGIVPFAFAEHYDVHVSGGEYNVAANLARCFGKRTAIASAIVDNPLGEKVAAEVRKMNVLGKYKHFKSDGVRGPNMALVWSDRGQGVRPPLVFYNRANEAAALLKPGDFDFAAIFDEGVRWFHSGGIFAALSDSTPKLIIEAMKIAHDHGAIVSFDLNYRAKLWAAANTGEKPSDVFGRIVEHVDVLLGNEEDLQMGLGLPGPDIHSASKLDPSSFLKTIEQVHQRWPNIKAVATTLRDVKSTNRHLWSAVLWIEGAHWVAPTMELDIYDRVGGGDGFASGLIYGLLDGADPEEALRLGWAHGALLTTYPGDTTMASLEQVKALAQGGSARIQR